MQDIDRLSRKVPVLCKVAPNSHFHIQDVNRAGGILSILGELAAAGLIDTTVNRVGYKNLAECLSKYNLKSPKLTQKAQKFYLSAPGGKFSRELGSQSKTYARFDTDRRMGCIRDVNPVSYTHLGISIAAHNTIGQRTMIRTDADSRSILPANLQKLRKFLPQDFQFSCILLIGIGQLLKSGPFIRKISRIYPHLFHITGGNRSSLSNKMNIRRNRSRISPFTQRCV